MSSTTEKKKNANVKHAGRPRLLDYSLIKEVILAHKQGLMSTEDGTVTSKTAEIWKTILAAFPKDARIPRNVDALYAFVVNNTDGVRDELRQALGVKVNSIPTSLNDSVRDDSGSNWEDSVIQDELLDFEFRLTSAEYLGIREIKTIKRNLKGNVVQSKKFIFKPFEWLRPINEKIWFASGRKCGYNNKNSYISADGESGNFTGYCKCGSYLQCYFKAEGEEYLFKCNVSEGDGQCRLLFLRKPLRTHYAEELMKESADVLQAHLATRFKHPDHNKRPPMVPEQTVLRTAKSQHLRSLYYDRDPIIALSVMKASDYSDDIHLVSIDPFKVHYWTTHQLQVYNRYLSSTQGPLIVDATGGFSPNFTKINGQTTHALFLYIGVINTSAGQFSVAQMISEAHDTVTIAGMWLDWLKCGFSKPPEVLMDSSRALVTAIILAFTKYKTIEDYADAGLTDEPSDCYVRYDVAHYLKMYSRVLKDAPRLVRIFYLGCMGKLLAMTDKNEIRKFIKNIFIVALFETIGPVKRMKERSLCQQAKDALLGSIINSDGDIDLGTENNENDPDDEGQESNPIHDYTLSSNDDDTTNSWYDWGLKIKEEVDEKRSCMKDKPSEDNGQEINGYRFPELVDRMILDIRHLPLFTGVTYHKYNYGRLPGSSASVECEIKKIKNYVFHKEKSRPDVAVKKHLDYLHGRMMIVEDHMDNLDQQKENSGKNDMHDGGRDTDEIFGRDKDNDINAKSSNHDFTPENPIDESFEGNSPYAHDEEDDASTESVLSPEIHRQPCANSSSKEDSATSKCIACAAGQVPSAHRCAQCEKPVHLLEGCSVEIAGTEEGFGQRRICVECDSKSSFNNENSLPKQSRAETPVQQSKDAESEVMTCTACLAGDRSSSHQCVRCKRMIHLSDKCSTTIPIVKEGSDQFRICLTCNSIPAADLNEFLSKQYVENWRGLGKPQEKKSRGLYTGGNTHKLRDILLLEKSKGLPVLKSGQSRGLKPVKVKNRQISLVFTCPFDSLFQILLAASCDYPVIRDRMKSEPHNKMFALIIDSLDNSLRAWTYRLRAEILIEYFPVTRMYEGIEEVDCKDEIRNFVKKIFKQTPSWTERSKCSEGCPERTTFIEIVSLPAESLANAEFLNVFENYIFPTDSRKCPNISCSGIEKITETIIGNKFTFLWSSNEESAIFVSFPGDMVIFEPYWINGLSVKQQLRLLPEEFLHPVDSTPMRLLGVIEFRSPRTRTSSLNDVGHYVPLCFRRDKQWVKYDDKTSKEEKIRNNYEPVISLIFYSKV